MMVLVYLDLENAFVNARPTVKVVLYSMYLVYT